MRLATLGSGSSGNATLLDTGEGLLMIDCGLSAREAERRMAELQIPMSDLQAILVTHEHADHIGGVSAFAAKSGVPVFATRGTARKLKCAYHEIRAEQAFFVPGCSVEIKPLAVPHDAREPVQFTFSKNSIKVGVLTDLGSVTPHVVEEFAGCQSLLVESNHCREMLSEGPYPAALKRRILGPWGHLSNNQTAGFLEQIFVLGSIPENLILGHISKENNSKARVEDCLGELVSSVSSLVFASQDEVLPWTDPIRSA